MIGPALYLWMVAQSVTPSSLTVSSGMLIDVNALQPRTLAVTLVPDGDGWAVTWLGRYRTAGVTESVSTRLSCAEDVLPSEAVRKVVVHQSGKKELEIVLECPQPEEKP